MTFESFVANQPERSPNGPGVLPKEPGVKPGTRPERRSPIRRHKPAVNPRPKAEVEDVISLFSIQASEELKNKIKEYYAKEN